MLWILLLAPLFPTASHLFLPLISLDKEWRVLAASFVTLLVTGLVYNLNRPITRLYEGYPWKESWIGKKRAARHIARFTKAKQLRARLRYLCDYLEAAFPASASLRQGRQRQTRLAGIVNSAFPSTAELVLPTRLGNTIRNFELYPTVQYGLSAIAFWPRLIAKIDDRYSQTIDGAKAGFDFMINASALSGATALCVLFLGVLAPTPLGLNSFTLSWIWRFAFFTLLTWLAYEGAIVQANDWGAQVKGAFDLYRLDLLRQLGYESVPYDRNEEKALWTAITQKTVYADMPREPQPTYAAAVTRVLASPAWMRVRVLRSVEVTANAPTEVTLEIQNLEPRRAARRLIVLDTVPDGQEYVKSSLTCSVPNGALLATRPFSYRLPALAPSASATISYKLAKTGGDP